MVKNEPSHQSAEEEKVEHREFEQSHLVENETPFKVPQVMRKKSSLNILKNTFCSKKQLCSRRPTSYSRIFNK